MGVSLNSEQHCKHSQERDRETGRQRESRTVALTTAGVELTSAATTHSGPSSAAVDATTDLKSATSLSAPPPYLAASATAGNDATKDTRGLTRGLNAGPDGTVLPVEEEEEELVVPPPLVEPPPVVVVVGGGAAAASGSGTAARRNVTARKLAEMLGWRSDSTAR